ncbi:hypothetical protein [Halochromatium glycolicum]|uniref:Uncharacterized protein n=1 Tax=Halochromatium glycolicum TaxID=85075 RepID=A0AAJ0XAA7_9GAMM|nr:hypothetical protein [Halochromatium glycolicum]MBK1705123.1 hypothetical protein [Halochromatium glycolicum]
MAMTNAERQRHYRQRHLKAVDGSGERLSIILSLQAKTALGRLASFHGTSQRATLERLILDAQAHITRGLTPEQQDQYHDQTLTAEALPGNNDDSPLPRNDEDDGLLPRNSEGKRPLPGNATVPRPDYPSEARQMAVRMADEGKPNKAIRQALMDTCGRAPSSRNLSKALRAWRAGGW